MRCSYCGGLNPDQAQFCARCGRDMRVKAPPNQSTASAQRLPYPPSQPQPSYQAPRQAPPAQGYPRPPQTPPYQQPGQVPPTQQRMPASSAEQRTTATKPPVSAAPEPPAQFPPRTMEHLNALEQGALTYSIVSETESVGRKKIVRILYQRCVPWQQVATLLKAFKEQHADKFDTIIIQGNYAQESSIYGFTNGQLQFDRNVRLGSQIMNRYQIETSNGFEASSIRIVLSD
jgi:hypothetical protein